MTFYKYLIAIISVLSGMGQVNAQSDLIALISVDAGKYARLNSPVSVDVTGLPLQVATLDLQLIEVTEGVRKEVPVQLEMGDRDRIWWILSGSTVAGAQRVFELRSKPKEPLITSVSVHDTQESISMQIGSKEVLQYVYQKPGVPDGVDDVYSRAGFIHPLRSPRGTVLTRIQPPDHYHHYGIWNPWTHTEFEGKEIDFWNLNKRQATVDVTGKPSVAEGQIFGELATMHKHRVKGQNGAEDKYALNEEWKIRVYNMDPEQKTYLVDINSVLSCASDSPLTITAYRYQGFGFRATENWSDDNTQLHTSEGYDKSNGNSTRARWCDVRGPGLDGLSGVVFITHPSNYNYPEQLRIWPVGANNGKENVFVNFNPAQDRDWKIEPGRKYALKYRLLG